MASGVDSEFGKGRGSPGHNYY